MIYLLEDDDSIRELVTYTLNSQGMEAEGFARPSQFWKALNQRMPSLVLLDIMLPEEDGMATAGISCYKEDSGDYADSKGK